MICRSTIPAALVIAWLAAGSSASAQFDQSRIQYPFGQPAVSPYLNLVGNNNAGINYFGLVVPQQQFYQQSEDLRRGVYSATPYQRQLPGRQNTDQQTGAIAGYRLGVTGHSTSFRSLGTKLPNGAQNAQIGLSAQSQSGYGQFGSMGSAGAGTGSAPMYSGHSSGFGYGPVYGRERGF